MSKKLKKIQNKKEIDFINSLPTISIEDTDDKLTEKCKFNFHYLSNNPPATTISEYGSDLLEKLKIFSQHSLFYWENLKHSGSNNGFYLVYYDSFPPEHKTEYIYPKHVPADVRWGWFILSGKQRLIGFVIPEEKHDQCHPKTGFRFDKNTFYCVFIDLEHKFWLMNKR
jgi:hypothetical protein